MFEHIMFIVTLSYFTYFQSSILNTSVALFGILSFGFTFVKFVYLNKKCHIPGDFAFELFEWVKC